MSSTPSFSPESLAILEYFRVDTSSGGVDTLSDGDGTSIIGDETSSESDQTSTDGIETLGDGYIRVPKAVVACSPDEALWDEFEDIPKFMESAETLRYLGFRPCVAHGLFQDWLILAARDPSEAGPAQFYKFVVGFIRDFVGNVMEHGDKWDRALKQMGFRNWVRSKKRNPRGSETILETTVKGWALWAVDTGWTHLRCMDWRVQHNRAIIEDRMEELKASATSKEVEAAAMLISLDMESERAF